MIVLKVYMVVIQSQWITLDSYLISIKFECDAVIESEKSLQGSFRVNTAY